LGADLGEEALPSNGDEQAEEGDEPAEGGDGAAEAPEALQALLALLAPSGILVLVTV
jgi:hypothetical protein